MQICAATGNPGKLAEMRRILQAQGHLVKSQAELGIALEPEETGATFAENAFIKAQAICAASGLPTIADDSGLEVTALDNAPGVFSARYCGHHGDDEANNDKLIKQLAGLPDENRQARFVSAVCLYLPGGKHITFLGECKGHIILQRRGTNGFGYDPLFVPERVGVSKTEHRPNTENRTYAELSAHEKDAISHRGNAMALLEAQLADFLQQAKTSDPDALSADPKTTIVQVEDSLSFERNQKFDGDRLTRQLR